MPRGIILRSILCMCIPALLGVPIEVTPSGRPSGATELQVEGVFRTYYDTHNGAYILGKPLTALMEVNGYPAQYFERGRLEDHRKDTSDPLWAFTYGNLVTEMTDCDPYGQVSGLAWGYGEPAGSNYFVNTIQLARAPTDRQPPPPGFSGGTVNKPGGVFVPFDSALRPAPGYLVPDYFWDFINRADLFPGGWLHDIGLPITPEREALTIREPAVGYIPVKVQAFERAVLVYDRTNKPGMQVWRADIGADAVRKLPQPRTLGVQVPARGATVAFPLHIFARVGIACQQIRATVTWQDSTKLVQDFTLHRGEDGRGLLVASLDWPNDDSQTFPKTQLASLELTDSEGRRLDKRSITVVNPGDPNLQEIALYFYRQNSEDLVQVTRRIPSTARIATATVEEMLWGPGPNERGLISAIPDTVEILNKRDGAPDWEAKVTLLGLDIRNGIALPNFSNEIHAYGGGSGRVRGIYEQITRTLMQFPSITRVGVAVEGKTENVLQP